MCKTSDTMWTWTQLLTYNPDLQFITVFLSCLIFLTIVRCFWEVPYGVSAYKFCLLKEVQEQQLFFLSRGEVGGEGRLPEPKNCLSFQLRILLLPC